MFYCLCNVKEMLTGILEEYVSDKRDPDLNEDEDIIIEVSREEHCRDVAEDGEDNSKIHALSWDAYTRER